MSSEAVDLPNEEEVEGVNVIQNPEGGAGSIKDAEGLMILEALIFAHGDPIAVEQLVAATAFSEERVHRLLNQLREKMIQHSSALQLVMVAGRYQLRTNPDFAEYVNRLKEQKPRKLSAASLETLAVIAYRQPVTKHDIDTIRGVDVGPTLKTLLDRELITVVGHKAAVGAPALYGTTEKFLELFGLSSLAELPSLREITTIDASPDDEAEAA